MQTNIEKENHNTRDLAIVSLVLSLCSVLIGPFGFIPGIILGYRARRDRTNSIAASIALAGIVIGYVFLALFIILLSLILFFLMMYPHMHGMWSFT